MVSATVTSKGQITIPKPVRDSLHLRTGDRVQFVVRGQDEAVLKPVTKSIDQVFGRLHRPGRKARTVAEMNAAISHRAKERGA
jgi:AbrB family looped-hinge helix DNA binding protein